MIAAVSNVNLPIRRYPMLQIYNFVSVRNKIAFIYGAFSAIITVWEHRASGMRPVTAAVAA